MNNKPLRNKVHFQATREGLGSRCLRAFLRSTAAAALAALARASVGSRLRRNQWATIEHQHDDGPLAVLGAVGPARRWVGLRRADEYGAMALSGLWLLLLSALSMTVPRGLEDDDANQG